MVEVQTAVFEYIRNAGNHPRITLPPEKRHQEAGDRALATWKTALKILDQRLASKAHLLGDGFTLCDCTVASVVSVGAMMGGLTIEEKGVQAWLERCTSRPALAKAMAD
jgi:glutathione S-transferase